jgi:hypothetical protein
MICMAFQKIMTYEYDSFPAPSPQRRGLKYEKLMMITF